MTLVRYQLPTVVIVFNNSGVYGGDRRSLEEIIGLFKDELALTSFIPGAAYHLLIDTFQDKGYLVGTPDELKSFAAQKPGVINFTVDPYAGSESGRLEHKN
ncbi:2-hydroxyacyl-CoA lyase-like [Rhododendron vialii]|uniref:2-hydroxyacyl-CoA lyase-like n=1 Tax=Rhododendron vialii TaxID=182163 RepID=UPI00265F9148|nr:2-hydroxyacyl-CoA lyase-like [Rhododendron vialii]